jgi:hypothetical protein
MITLQQDLLHSALNAVTRASTKSTLMAAFSLVRLDVHGRHPAPVLLQRRDRRAFHRECGLQ